MKVSVVGAGYVGLVTAACLAELGNTVTVLDIDRSRVLLLQSGSVPIFEPGLEEMLNRNLRASRLKFTHITHEAIDAGDAIFIAVGTPPQEDGSADLQHVLSVAHQIGQYMKDFKVVINKSTVPVGTADRVESAIQQELDRRGMHFDFAVISNPEFLKEGAAIDDFMRPDRIVVGVPHTSVGERAKHFMTHLYAPFNRHHERTVWMDVRSAELTKYAANAMLATRISFMNEMARLADAFGADIDAVRRGIGSDQRIGPGFLYAGTGYAGSCFPKDTRALINMGHECNVQMRMIEATEEVNRNQKLLLLERVVSLYGDDLRGLNFAVWGLAFKPNTDDLREAPSRLIVAELLRRGAKVQAHDPVAMLEARQVIEMDLAEDKALVANLFMAETPEAAVNQADMLVVITEWKCFHSPDFDHLAHLMRTPQILDGRNLYDPIELQELGIPYQGIGRRNDLEFNSIKSSMGEA